MGNGIYSVALLFVAIVGVVVPPFQNSPKAQKLTAMEVAVKDTAGIFIVGATITLKSIEHSTVTVLQSDAKGTVVFPDLQPGAYDLRIEAPGFKTVVFEKHLDARPVLTGYTIFLKGDGVINPVENYKEKPYSPVNEKFNVNDLKKDIKKNLPLGSSPAQVSEFLNERSINPSKLHISKYDSDYPTDEDVKLIRALIRRVSKGLFGYWGISMSFRFDENDRLIDYKVRWSGLGN